MKWVFQLNFISLNPPPPPNKNPKQTKHTHTQHKSDNKISFAPGCKQNAKYYRQNESDNYASCQMQP